MAAAPDASQRKAALADVRAAGVLAARTDAHAVAGGPTGRQTAGSLVPGLRRRIVRRPAIDGDVRRGLPAMTRDMPGECLRRHLMRRSRIVSG